MLRSLRLTFKQDINVKAGMLPHSLCEGENINTQQACIYCTLDALVNLGTGSSPEGDSTVTTFWDQHLASLHHRQLQSQDDLLRALNPFATACITYVQDSGAIKIQTMMTNI